MAKPSDKAFTELVGALRNRQVCGAHPALARSTSPEDAEHWWEVIQRCAAYRRREHLRWFARNDLFFLLVYILNRKHFLADTRKANWTFARSSEVQDAPDNHLDLWSREHFKSEIITFGLTIKDILSDPEITIGIFSHTRPMAKDFLGVIKREFETNILLKDLFPEIIWDNCKYDARAHSVSWSENDGITVKRRGNPKEATVEASGLVDGQPTGKRYRRLIYDDVVARDNITPLMIQQTTEQFDNSLLLTASDPPIFRYIGTFQEFGDTTHELIKRHVGELRLRGPFDDNRNPACLSNEKFQFFKQTLTPKVFALQILLDPGQAKDPNEVGFNRDWIDYWTPDETSLNGHNKYILVDPAGSSPESNSRYAQWVVALGADKCVRVLDIVCDKYDLEERWNSIFEAVQKYEPLKVGYETIGLQADIEHFKYRMKELNQQFTIVSLNCGGGHAKQHKDERIGSLIPLFRDKRVLLPKNGIKKRLKDGREVDMCQMFMEQEYLIWPFNPKTRDMLDALSRINDPALNIVWPKRYGSHADVYTSANVSSGDNPTGSWMSG
jgi:hypothetical protein